MSKHSNRLRVLSFNIQVGIDSGNYSDYIRNSWRHILPYSGRQVNLARIAEILKDYDLVALQEVDAGSLRSHNVNQVEYLAQQAGFPHCHWQCNRNLARVAAHANGLLSKIPAEVVIDHALPGMIPGRGALEVSFGYGKQPLVVVVAHLSLGHRTRCNQLRYIADILSGYEHFVLMGDMNCEYDAVVSELRRYGVKAQAQHQELPTYPSWKPRRQLDQIVISENIYLEKVEVLAEPISDHLPIAMDICIPGDLASNILDRNSVSNFNP
nr:endonuclease/exonuclease/phosphatase family protein [Pleionea sp. CnH1-48]